MYNEIFASVKPLIQKQNTNMRNAITSEEKLSLALRFLASGASYRDLAFSFPISPSTVSQIVPEVCSALYKTFKDEYLHVPSSREEWQRIEHEFEAKWQFPHCLRAIDRKHINIRAPPNTGSEYFYYKNHLSIVLLAIADSNAQFIAFQLRDAASQSDGGIFKHGDLSKLCKSESFSEPQSLTPLITQVPYFLIGDEAFALDVNLMKPFPDRSAMGNEKVFNYRLSRARRIVENGFDAMCNRFRVLFRTLGSAVAELETLDSTCCTANLALRCKCTLLRERIELETSLPNISHLSSVVDEFAKLLKVARLSSSLLAILIFRTVNFK